MRNTEVKVNTKRMFFVGIVVLTAIITLSFFVGSALADGKSADITVVYEDEFIIVYQDGDYGTRLVVNKVGGVDTYCQCETVCPEGAKVIEETVPTATQAVPVVSKTPPPTATKPVPTPTNTPVSTATTPPTATEKPPATEEPKPEKKYVQIVHYTQKGKFVWDKCMPASAWNGHKHHPYDENLGSCTR